MISSRSNILLAGALLSFSFSLLMDNARGEPLSEAAPLPLATRGREYFMFVDVPNVVSVTLKEQKATEAPAAIDVVTAAEIKRKGYRSLKDVMLDIPGWANVSDGNEEIIAVRGVYASTTNKILILLNGHRLNDLNLGRYNTDQFMSMDTVERIELIKGPGSVLYGTGALVGVVNIITKKGSDIDGIYAKYKHSIRGRSADSETSFSWGKNINGLDLLANFVYLDAAGDEVAQPAYLDVVPAGVVKAEGKLYMEKYPRNWSIFTSAAYGDFKLNIRREHYARAVPRCPGTSSLYDYDLELTKPLYEEDISLIGADYKYDFDNVSKITFSSEFNSYHLKELTWISSYGANRIPLYGTRSGQDSEYNQWQAKTYYERGLLNNLDCLVGFDVLAADFYNMNAVSGSDGTAFTTTPMPTGSWVLAAGFAQFIWSPLDKLEVTIGSRVDTFQSVADPKVSSRYGAVYKLTEALNAKLLYGQSLLSPEWAHVKRLTVGAFTANSGLKPESFDGWDFILEYNKTKAGLTLNLFSNHVENLISAGTATSYENMGEITYQGLELTGKYSLLEKLVVNGSYSLVRNTGNTTPTWIVGHAIKNIPQNIFRWGLTYSPIEKMEISMWGRSYSRVRTSDNVTGNTYLAGWTTFDLSVNYALSGWDFQITLANLLDRKYSIGGANRPLEQPGMAARISLARKF